MEIYHQHNSGLPLADRIGYIARLRMYRLFLECMRPDPASRILDIGVTDDVDSRSANLLERLYPHRERIVCAGITDGRAIRRRYPGVGFVEIGAGRPLPFADGAFDIVYSNAVLEHVGSRERQAGFVREACRVGKRVFLAVPNRLFPVEVHTGIPLLHFLPQRWFRAALRRSRFHELVREENLNYVSPGELRRMYPIEKPARTLYSGIGLGPFRSNLVAVACGSGAGR